MKISAIGATIFHWTEIYLPIAQLGILGMFDTAIDYFGKQLHLLNIYRSYLKNKLIGQLTEMTRYK
ncbi:MAG: hypothetical protein K1562_15280 [Candidatus Thiodiazotropha sp. (ex. Lucinisca nassula)]|nr:hypothetical protein [Candidatus Thiodiazotropha sp. (ex. Lucinisca nassula)]